eukprot:1140927-Pelagomonas_calceolata.AAC.11
MPRNRRHERGCNQASEMQQLRRAVYKRKTKPIGRLLGVAAKHHTNNRHQRCRGIHDNVMACKMVIFGWTIRMVVPCARQQCSKERIRWQI